MLEKCHFALACDLCAAHSDVCPKSCLQQSVLHWIDCCLTPLTIAEASRALGASALGVHDAPAGAKPPRLFGTRPWGPALTKPRLLPGPQGSQPGFATPARSNRTPQTCQQSHPRSPHFQLLSTSYDRTTAYHDEFGLSKGSPAELFNIPSECWEAT